MQTKSQSNQEKKYKYTRGVITGTKEIKRIVSNNCTRVYMNKSDNLDETDNFLGK